MTKLTIDQQALLNAGRNRHSQLEVLHAQGQADSDRLQTLIGKVCHAGDKTYLITRVHYGYNGFISARGYRILKDGTRGTQQWDIGTITSINFGDDA